MENGYLSAIKQFESKIKSYVDAILLRYNYELQILMANYNVLARENNTIESSTAVGYLSEEFIVSKLIETTSKNGSKPGEFRILPNDAATAEVSYDCNSRIKFGEKDIFAMINIKVEKEGSANDAVAAITQLHEDYCLINPDKEKCFMVLKLKYKFDGEGTARAVKMTGVDTYFLEELDFSRGHKQDYRNWSGVMNNNSGRLKISRKFREEHKLPKEKVSYHKLFMDLDSLFHSNN